MISEDAYAEMLRRSAKVTNTVSRWEWGYEPASPQRRGRAARASGALQLIVVSALTDDWSSSTEVSVRTGGEVGLEQCSRALLKLTDSGVVEKGPGAHPRYHTYRRGPKWAEWMEARKK